MFVDDLITQHSQQTLGRHAVLGMAISPPTGSWTIFLWLFQPNYDNLVLG